MNEGERPGIEATMSAPNAAEKAAPRLAMGSNVASPAAEVDTARFATDRTLLATDATSADAALSPRSFIGRYIVLERLGAGGMGVVYAAYDPELDRKVALKLLLPQFAGSEPGLDNDRSTRLLREAQALV